MNQNCGNANRDNQTDHRDIQKTDSVGPGDWVEVEMWEPCFGLGNCVGFWYY